MTAATQLGFKSLTETRICLRYNFLEALAVTELLALETAR